MATSPRSLALVLLMPMVLQCSGQTGNHSSQAFNARRRADEQIYNQPSIATAFPMNPFVFSAEDDDILQDAESLQQAMSIVAYEPQKIDAKKVDARIPTNNDLVVGNALTSKKNQAFEAPRWVRPESTTQQPRKSTTQASFEKNYYDTPHKSTTQASFEKKYYETPHKTTTQSSFEKKYYETPHKTTTQPSFEKKYYETPRKTTTQSSFEKKYYEPPRKTTTTQAPYEKKYYDTSRKTTTTEAPFEKNYKETPRKQAKSRVYAKLDRAAVESPRYEPAPEQSYRVGYEPPTAASLPLYPPLTEPAAWTAPQRRTSQEITSLEAELIAKKKRRKPQRAPILQERASDRRILVASDRMPRPFSMTPGSGRPTGQRSGSAERVPRARGAAVEQVSAETIVPTAQALPKPSPPQQTPPSRTYQATPPRSKLRSTSTESQEDSGSSAEDSAEAEGEASPALPEGSYSYSYRERHEEPIEEGSERSYKVKDENYDYPEQSSQPIRASPILQRGAYRGVDYDQARAEYVDAASRAPDYDQAQGQNVQSEVAHEPRGEAADLVQEAGHHHKEHQKPKAEHKEGEAGASEEHHEGDHHESGEHGEKVYKELHEHDEGKKGHHDKENHDHHYDEKEGKDKEHHEAAGYHEEHEKDEEGEKGAAYNEKGKHNKGHSTKGEHVIHKKDEFEKKTEFFDEFHEGGDQEKEGGFHEEHGHKKGGHHKKGHHHEGQEEHKHGEKGHHDKGHHHHDHKGHDEEEGHDHHHQHEEKHGKKAGHEDHKHWHHKKGDRR